MQPSSIITVWSLHCFYLKEQLLFSFSVFSKGYSFMELSHSVTVAICFITVLSCSLLLKYSSDLDFQGLGLGCGFILAGYACLLTQGVSPCNTLAAAWADDLQWKSVLCSGGKNYDRLCSLSSPLPCMSPGSVKQGYISCCNFFFFLFLLGKASFASITTHLWAHNNPLADA